jgi:hypothetical protein
MISTPFVGQLQYSPIFKGIQRYCMDNFTISNAYGCGKQNEDAFQETLNTMFGKPFYEFIHLHINLLASLKAWAY